MTPPKTAAIPAGEQRRRTGAWYTPEHLVDLVVARTVTADWVATFDRPIRLLDPACGDGRFLAAAAHAIGDAGGRVDVTAVDIDAAALHLVAADPVLAEADRRCGDALALEWDGERFDLVLGNPPFLSQLSALTSRHGASRHGGGPYADAAAEFLALAARLCAAEGGRFALVLPQSILASRDAGDVRSLVDRTARRLWSWWSPTRQFDAEVVVCAVGFERCVDASGPTQTSARPGWTDVVLDELGIPPLPALRSDGRLGDRATLNANFRDEYYALVAAVTAGGDGPPLVTSGLIDPGRCRWGERPVRFAKQLHEAPRIDLARLDPRMQRWAGRKLVPKVLVANQTRIIEAVADTAGAWLPGVPVTTVTPEPGVTPDEIAAVLSSPVASAWVWERAAGTGLSARSIRLGPALLGDLPWPAGDLSEAAAAVAQGDIVGAAALTMSAYGLDPADPDTAAFSARLTAWWRSELDRATSGAPHGSRPEPAVPRAGAGPGRANR